MSTTKECTICKEKHNRAGIYAIAQHSNYYSRPLQISLKKLESLVLK